VSQYFGNSAFLLSIGYTLPTAGRPPVTPATQPVVVNVPVENPKVINVVATPDPAAAARAAAQAQADADAAQAAQLSALQEQQRQAELDAAAAGSYDQALTEEPKKFGPWLWVGAAAGGLALIVIGFAVTKKKPMAGYRHKARKGPAKGKRR